MRAGDRGRPRGPRAQAGAARRLAEHVGRDCVLATNTSSLSVTAIAAGVPHPERVVGMHFFNPAPLMALRGDRGRRAVRPRGARARPRLGAAMDRRVIDAADGPGFLVNRCNRPYVARGAAARPGAARHAEQVDRICRLAGGFRMGPFALMDLVGIDVGLAVAEVLPPPVLRRAALAPVAAAGADGRRRPARPQVRPRLVRVPRGPPPDPALPKPGGGDGRLVVIAGDGLRRRGAARRRRGGRLDRAEPVEAEGELPLLILDCGAREDEPHYRAAHQAILCDSAPLAALDPGGGAAGFHVLPPSGAWSS